MSKKQSDGIRIIHTSNVDEVKKLTKEGWEPVECSIGGESLVGRLQMDHHGALSHLEGVAVRAYRDHFGACKDAQGFVVTGAADADATFAIAALAGLLPHPSRAAEFETAPGWLKEAMTADRTALATLVNAIDCEPIKLKATLPASTEGRILLAWGAFASGIEDRTAFHAGVDRWRTLTGPKAPQAMIDAAGAEEANRILAARQTGGVRRFDKLVTVLESRVWGFDVWYADFSPCIVALQPDGNITVGVQDVETAEKMFGPGGLKNIFAELQPSGWGGREAIGGSPRGEKMDWNQAIAAGEILARKARV
jgi:hypothetical protein